MTRTLWLAVVLICVHLAPAQGAAGLDVGDRGLPVVNVPGKRAVASSPFLWYDRWIWRSAERLEPAGEGRWRGVIARREDDGAGAIEVTQTAEGGGDVLRLRYELRRRGEMQLTRGVFLAFHLPRPDYAGRHIVCTHGPPLSTDDHEFEVAARGLTVNLSETDALQITCPRASRFRVWVDDDRTSSINVRLVPNDMGASATADLTLRIVPALSEPRPWLAEPQAAPLALSGARADKDEVALHDAVEFTLDVSATFENPFDPDQIAVEAEFLTPSGRTERRPGFYHQPFEGEYEEGEELLAMGGEPSWKVRYTPREPGEHSATFRARDGSGEAAFGPLSLRCVDSELPTFVRIGPEQDGGPRYFRREDGSSVFLIGHNVTTYPGNLDEVFRRMAAGGENYTRFWMWSHGLGLEWGLPVGHYRLEEAWRLDRALELAREHGVYLMLCLDTHQDFRGGWPRNPYNAARGGPCAEPMGFFTGDRARSLYRRRLRYVVARWGHHPNVLCWEFGNEMEGWPGAQEHRDVVAGWHAEMARHLADLDPYDHPITSSLWTTDGWPELWGLPEMEIVQSHFYANNMWADMAGRVADICRQKRRDYARKPHLFGEYGVSSGANTRRWDSAGLHLHNGNWAALACGAASNPVSWWHESYIDALDLYDVYSGLAAFVRGEPLADRRWQPVRVLSVEYAAPLQKVVYTDLEWSARNGGWDAPVPEGTRFVVRRDGTVENAEELPDVLHGGGHPELRSPFVFDVDCRQPTRFLVHVTTVSASGQLQFELDGEVVRTVELPTGEGLGTESRWQEEWEIWQTDYNETYGIDVPAGRHTVRLTNGGQDWIQIGYFKLEDYVTNEDPPLRVLGQVAEDRALLWVQNTAHAWFNVRESRPVPPVEPVRVTLGDVPDGRWRVELWDTVEGRLAAASEAAAEDGTLALDLPQVRTDVALKLLRP
jgi:hypothetical protein